MMRKSIYKSIALLMAFLMLMSTVGISADLHFCQGHLKSAALIGKAKNCHQLKKKTPSCHHKKLTDSNLRPLCEVKAGNCCSNKALYLKCDTDQLSVAAEFFSKSVNELPAIIPDLLNFQFAIAEVLNKYDPAKRYKPPLINKSRHILYDTFLL